MLELRPNCECCGASLPAGSVDAYICSFECTFCGTCCSTVLRGACPNCSGELVRRPTRAESLLAKYPASTKVTIKKAGGESRDDPAGR